MRDQASLLKSLDEESECRSDTDDLWNLHKDAAAEIRRLQAVIDLVVEHDSNLIDSLRGWK